MTSAAIEIDDSEDYGEVRYNALGFLDARLHSLTFTVRGEVCMRSVCAERPDSRRRSMPKVSKEPIPDKSNPEWTKDRVRKAMRFGDLPASLQSVLLPKTRGPQRTPVKQPVSLRLSHDVLEALRATGPGWQTRADEALRKRFVSLRKSA